MKFTYNDGGREASGFYGKHKGDCVCRAISIATERPYSEIYALILHFAKKERKARQKFSDPENGVRRTTSRKIMELLGWRWVPTMGIGTGCKVHLRDGEIPSGRIVADVSRHFTAVVDGVINDLYDPSRGGNRCVYGYYCPTDNALKPSDPLPLALELPTPAKRTDTRPKSPEGSMDANALSKARRTHNRERNKYDKYGWLIFTPASMRRAVEALITSDLRPYYLGCEIEKAWEGPLTADNSELYVYFKKPVEGPLNDVRYVHTSLYELIGELDACYIPDRPSKFDVYAEYDDEFGYRKVVDVRIPPLDLYSEREKFRNTWRKKASKCA